MQCNTRRGRGRRTERRKIRRKRRGRGGGGAEEREEEAPGVLHFLLALGDTASSSVPSQSLAGVRVTFTGDTTGSAASLGKGSVSRNRSSLRALRFFQMVFRQRLLGLLDQELQLLRVDLHLFRVGVVIDVGLGELEVWVHLLAIVPAVESPGRGLTCPEGRTCQLLEAPPA